MEQLKNRLLAWGQEHEGPLTCALVAVAVLLLLIAFFGEPHHKLIAMMYVVL